MTYLLKLVLEIEGYLRILDARDDQTARQLLLEKIDLLKEKATEIYHGQVSVDSEIHQHRATPHADDDTVFHQAIDEFIPEISTEEPHITDEAPAIPDEATAIPDEAPAITDEAPAPGISPIEPEELGIEDTPMIHAQSHEQDPIRIEDIISHRQLSDFARAFTINDKFRFSRELFHNDREKFEEAIKLLNSMHTLDEAYDYLLNDLGWDADDDTVSEFIALVASHFNALS